MEKRIWMFLVARGIHNPVSLSSLSYSQITYAIEEDRWQRIYEALLKLFKLGFIEVEQPLSQEEDLLQSYIPVVPDPQNCIKMREIRNYYHNCEFIVEGEYRRPKRVRDLYENCKIIPPCKLSHL